MNNPIGFDRCILKKKKKKEKIELEKEKVRKK